MSLSKTGKGPSESPNWEGRDHGRHLSVRGISLRSRYRWIGHIVSPIGYVIRFAAPSLPRTDFVEAHRCDF